MSNPAAIQTAHAPTSPPTPLRSGSSPTSTNTNKHQMASSPSSAAEVSKLAAMDEDAPAALPFLLACPAALLAAILEHLDGRELMTLPALTTKHPALVRFGNHDDGMKGVEQEFWTGTMARFLGQFQPAGPWFGLKGRHSGLHKQ